MKLLPGSVHTLTPEITRFAQGQGLAEIWNGLTPLARNEWICWITSAKKTETTGRRMDIMQDKLNRGERRPCCWAGCPHRK